MNRFGSFMSRRLLLALGAMVALGSSVARAQGTPEQEPVRPRARGFRLFGLADFAITGLRQGGNSYWKTTSTGPSDDDPSLPADLSGRVIGTASSPTSYCCGYFELQLWATASRSDWVRNRDIVPSLENAKGGGWAASTHLRRWGVTTTDFAWTGRDGSVGTLYSGVTTSNDGSCRDNTARANAFIDPGIPLLAGSDCPPTWAGGVFSPEHPVPDTTFLRLFTASPSTFTFDEKAIPNATRPQDKLYGSFQTYGRTNDYGRERLAKFGNVVPGGTGGAQYEGYPLGIEWQWQVFTYAVPTLADAMFYKANVINNSAEVYGTGINYDSLYLGFQIRPFHTTSTQQPAVYAAPDRGAVLSNQTNDNNQNCYGAVHGSPVTGGYTAGTNIISCLSNTQNNRGFRGGAGALLILKSPIGDLRNKKFTDPSSPFYNPTHPLRGDTLTYNHVNGCGFTCASADYPVTANNARTRYGMVTNNEADVLGGAGKTSGDYTERQYFGMFHTPNWPTRWSPSTGAIGGFARAVPSRPDGVPWDYDHNGVPDTLKVMTCTGTTMATYACEKPWVDTLPGGFPNGVHNNYWAGVGPIKLKAGDTTEFVVAIVSSPDSITIEQQLINYTALYQSFWLSPEPPCPTNIVSATTIGGNRQYDTEIRLFFDNAVNTCQDKFLLAQAQQLRNSRFPADIALKVFNPQLVNSIRSRALPTGTALRDTVPKDTTTATVNACYTAAATGSVAGVTASCNIVTATAVGVIDSLFVYKSCDFGNTYTASTGTACVPSPVRDISGSAPRYFWQAYAKLTRDAAGQFPRSFRDGSVTGGVTYTYVVVGQSYAASFPIVTPSGGALVPSTYTIRPVTLNALTANTANRNVAVVYLPASRQAGSDSALVKFNTITTQAGVPQPANDTIAAYIISTRLAKPVSGTNPIKARVELSDSAEITVVDNNIATPAVNSTKVKLFALVDTGWTSSTAPKRFAYKVDSFLVTDSVYGVDLLLRSGRTAISTTTTGATRTTIYRMSPTSATALTSRSPQATLLLDYGTGAGYQPVFVTDSFPSGADFTPPTTIARADFPGFLVTFDPTRQKQLQPIWWTAPNIPNLRADAWPNLTWLSTAKADTMAYSRYRIIFGTREFGPGAPFTLNTLHPEELQAAFTSSVSSRPTISTTDVTASTAALISKALGRTGATVITTDSLATLSLPFTVVDEKLNRPVTLAALKRQHPATALFGSGSDTVRVQIPSGMWVPGDSLYFIESYQTFKTDTITIGGVTRERVKITAGKPDTVTLTTVTWSPAIIGCSGTVTCNPITGVGGTSYTSVSPDEALHVLYTSPIADARLGTPLFGLDYQISPTVSGTAVATVSDNDLKLVKVVPNPYIMFSAYEQQNNTKRLLFTHLPPTGTIRIYTASGQFVQQLDWQPSDLNRNCTATTVTTECVATGDLFWNMRTREDLEIGPGFYVFVVSSRIGGKKAEKMGKFVVIH